MDVRPERSWSKHDMVLAIAGCCRENGRRFDPCVKDMGRAQMFARFLTLKSERRFGTRVTELYGVDEDAVTGCFPPMTEEDEREADERERMKNDVVELSWHVDAAECARRMGMTEREHEERERIYEIMDTIGMM